MIQKNAISATRSSGTGGTIGDPAKRSDAAVLFHVRDIIQGRSGGDFETEAQALASLKGRSEGHFSINNHKGGWCEVEVRQGKRFVRHALMENGRPVEFVNIDFEA